MKIGKMVFPLAIALSLAACTEVTFDKPSTFLGKWVGYSGEGKQKAQMTLNIKQSEGQGNYEFILSSEGFSFPIAAGKLTREGSVLKGDKCIGIPDGKTTIRVTTTGQCNEIGHGVFFSRPGSFDAFMDKYVF
jgi:hypothetical protein